MSDRVALVTGGSRGIGLAIAHQLIADGMSVCITARKRERLADAAAELGNSEAVLTAAGRSDDPHHQRATVKAVIERWGRIDVLVNNAGVNPVYATLVDTHQRAAEKVISVNLHAPLGWVREIHSLSAGLTVIVNIASYSAVRPSPGIGMYGASKAALLQLTRQLASELAPDVRVNAVVPALIDTGFSERFFEGRREQMERAYPLARLGRPQDVASAVAFLASDSASWITGECLVIDGGLSLTGGVA